MRKIFMVGISVCLLACASGKRIRSNTKIVISSGCKAGVTCAGTIQDSKRLEFNVDEEGVYHYKLTEDKNTAVVTLSYDRDLPKNVQDGQYREEIIFEIPNDKTVTNIKLDKSSKAIFGRFCYCKGTTGYYPVNTGQLNLEVKDRQLKGHVSFQVTEVPQIWKEASFSIQ